MAAQEVAPLPASKPMLRPQPEQLCVSVDVAGHRAGQTECAAQRLDDAAKRAQAGAQRQANTLATDARSADVVTGVANQTATRQRMGNTFGIGVRPQRPAPPVFSAPVSPGPPQAPRP